MEIFFAPINRLPLFRGSLTLIPSLALLASERLSRHSIAGRAFVDIEVIVLLLQHLSVKAFRTILRYQSGRYCVNSGVACDSVWESLLHFLIRDIEVKELSFETGISKNHWQSLKSSCKRLCIRYRGENLLHQRVTFLSEA